MTIMTVESGGKEAVEAAQIIEDSSTVFRKT
jgi:hypothetical protein